MIVALRFAIGLARYEMPNIKQQASPLAKRLGRRMARCEGTHEIEKSTVMNSETAIARQIAAEDIQIGQYIAKLHNLNTCKWCELLDEDWKQRSKWDLPWDIEPYQVKAVCLPYILVIDPDGDVETFDARRHRFALLPECFGRVPFDVKEQQRKREAGEEVRPQEVAAYEVDEQ